VRLKICLYIINSCIIDMKTSQLEDEYNSNK
jgi:hypothetical protein